MTLRSTTHAGRVSSHANLDLAWMLVIAAVVVGLLLVLTVVYGFHAAGPSLETVPDPAGLYLPF
jgi:hypothetical protein